MNSRLLLISSLLITVLVLVPILRDTGFKQILTMELSVHWSIQL